MAGTVEVVLPIYQGARFLSAQLTSLQAQTHPIQRLLVGDDGSTDGGDRLATVGGAVARVEVLSAGTERLGPRGNVSRLLALTTAPHVLLCDQDDLWYPHKVARLVEAATAAEARLGPQVPLLVVHDLAVIDAAGRPIATSFWRHQRFDPRHGSRLGTLLAMNSFPGCAMLVNRALLDRALPIPPEAVMHDWWLALIAASCGRIEVVSAPLMGYRLHSSNAVGAPVAGWSARLLRGRFPSISGARKASLAAALQARALRRRLTSGVQSRQVSAMAALPRLATGHARHMVAKHGIGKTGLLRHLRFLSSL